MTDLVILDLDGTLAHTVPGIAHAVGVALSQLGLPVPDAQAVQSNIGGGARELIENLVRLAEPPPREAGQLAQEALAIFSAYYNAHADIDTELYPGVRETLTELHTRAKLAVATAKTRAGTMRIFERRGLADCFDRVVTASEMAKPKPDPWCLLDILQHLNIPAGKAIYVGDTPSDAHCAQAAGVEFWLAAYGYGYERALPLGLHSRVITSFTQLKEITN
ncbi:MAG: HAD-IA family hydrolase [Propionibacteriaceae bacterium]|nr:HAD-IA family hydrolase [Propionibacteriaceae bacterium]